MAKAPRAANVRRIVRHGATLMAALLLIAVLAPDAGAYGIYTSGTTGYDISYPQCDGTYPTLSEYPLGVVGVTNGHAFRNNPCFATEYAWAAHTMAPESVYLNLNEDIGVTALYGDIGPYGVCAQDSACHALNYGYNAASSAYTYAAQVQTFVARMWWLDIETLKFVVGDRSHAQSGRHPGRVAISDGGSRLLGRHLLDDRDVARDHRLMADQSARLGRWRHGRDCQIDVRRQLHRRLHGWPRLSRAVRRW